jgi:hypothetical protein
MDEETNVRHWTDHYNASSYSDEDRTLSLVDHISKIYKNFIGKTIIEGNIFAELEKQTKIDDLFTYLKKHPGMVKFYFDYKNKMSTIEVDRDTKFTFNPIAKKRLCDMSYYIIEMLQILMSNSSTDWQTAGGVKVVMSSGNHTYCIEKGHSNPLATPSDIPVSAGGSKSRRRHRRHRKPARKTRRGRTRKTKSKTHRRGRHSHVRKHKKNTYTRRR